MFGASSNLDSELYGTVEPPYKIHPVCSCNYDLLYPIGRGILYGGSASFTLFYKYYRASVHNMYKMHKKGRKVETNNLQFIRLTFDFHLEEKKIRLEAE